MIDAALAAKHLEALEHVTVTVDENGRFWLGLGINPICEIEHGDSLGVLIQCALSDEDVQLTFDI